VSPLYSTSPQSDLLGLGIAMIPESLIAVLTITFVTGMTQMRNRRVLTRKLSALEALGGITNICSDKTGTLTQGQMVARKVWVPQTGVYTIHNVEDASDPTAGTVSLDPTKVRAELEAEKAEKRERLDLERSSVGLKFDVPVEKKEKDQQRFEMKETHGEPASSVEVGPQLKAFLESTALCNLATVRQDPRDGKWQTTGDPTEVALQVLSHRFGKGKKALEECGWQQLAEYPFDSSIKRMSTVYKDPTTRSSVVFTKGAVERVLDLCVDVGVGDCTTKMTRELEESIVEQMGILADQGLRVLAVARKESSGDIQGDDVGREEIEKNLTLLGLAGLYDPPRLETKDAVRGE
jgi:P-type Na+/K+ transporter